MASRLRLSCADGAARRLRHDDVTWRRAPHAGRARSVIFGVNILGGAAMRANCILIIVYAMVSLVNFQAPVRTPQPENLSPFAPPPRGSLDWYLSRPWRQLGAAVTEQKFEQDKEKCVVIASMAPAGPRSPQVTFVIAWIHCMKAAGYEPVP